MRILLTVLLLFWYSHIAQAVVIYDWEGACASGCTGNAIGVLTLADTYIPGTEVLMSDFISFSYLSSTGSFQIPIDLALNRFENGILPAISGRSVEWVEIDAIQDNTGLNACGAANLAIPAFCPSDGYWYAEFVPTGIVDDVGNSHTWTLRTSVPEPVTLVLMSLGLAGLGFTRRKAK